MQSNFDFSELLNSSQDQIFLEPLDQNYDEEIIIEQESECQNQKLFEEIYIKNLNVKLFESFEMNTDDNQSSTEGDSDEFIAQNEKKIKLSSFFNDDIEKEVKTLREKVLEKYNERLKLEEKIKSIFSKKI